MSGASFLLLVLLTFALRALGSELYAIKSPGCGQSCDPPTRSLVEVVYKNDSSSTHFVLSSSDYFRVPSVFVLRGVSNSTNLTFDWTGINNSSPNSIKASGPTTCYGVAFLTLNSTSSIPLSILSWRLVDFTEVPDNRTGILQVTLKSEGSRNKRYFKSKGYVSLTFSFSTRNSHASHPPHIFSYAGISVLVDFTVTRLIDEYASAPLSLQAAFFAANESLAGGEEFRASRVTTINDELTPGVFETDYVYLNEKTNSVLPSRPPPPRPPAYVQWHPVFYADPNPELKSSRQVVASAQLQPTASDVSAMISSVAYALLGDRLRPGRSRPVAWRLQNFTFDESASSPYITWSILLSLGSPHSETFSVGLWGLSAISCGILGLIFILASVYALVCWRRRHRGQFTPLLNESDSVADAQVKT